MSTSTTLDKSMNNKELLLSINFSKKSKSFKAFKKSELNPTSTTLNFDLK